MSVILITSPLKVYYRSPADESFFTGAARLPPALRGVRRGDTDQDIVDDTTCFAMATGAQTPALAPCASMRGGVRRVLRVSRPIARASPAPSRGTACVYGVLGRAIACAVGGSQHVGADATHIAHRPSHPVRGRVVSRAASANLGGGGLVSQDVPKMKVAELKLELEQRGLPTNGLKPALVERLSLYFACRDACRDGNGSMGGDEDASSDDASSDDAKKQSSSDDASSSDAKNQSADLSDSTYLREPKPDSSAGSVRPTKERESKPYQRTMFNSKPVDRVGGGVEINDESVSNFSGMELTFLGTSSGSPSFTRNVSSYGTSHCLREHDVDHFSCTS